MEVSKTLLSKFEKAYEEFKQYSNFYITFVEEAKTALQSREDFFRENLDNPDKIEDFLIEYSSLPFHYSSDLEKNKERLISVYETVQDFIEIPQEIKTEMEDILKMKSPLLFKIEDNKPILINPEHLELIKQELKKQGIVSNILKQLKSTSE